METSREILEAIRDRDPDGWETVQISNLVTAQQAFRAWVIKTYGRQAWRDYHGIWDE